MKNYVNDTKVLTGKDLLFYFETHINHVIVEYGKWGEYGFKHFSAENWFLHYDEIQKLESAHVIILYKDGTFEELSSGLEIKKSIPQDWVFGKLLFVKMFFKYLFVGFKDLELMIRLYRLRKK